MDILLCGLIEQWWEINVVKLKYPLKHYCKQSAIDIKKSVFNKVSTFVRLWKWNDLEKGGEWVNVEVDMYLVYHYWYVFREESKNFTCCRFFYPLLRASLPSILPRFLFFPFFHYVRWKIFSSRIDFHHYWCTTEYPLYIGLM